MRQTFVIMLHIARAKAATCDLAILPTTTSVRPAALRARADVVERRRVERPARSQQPETSPGTHPAHVIPGTCTRFFAHPSLSGTK